MKAVFCFFGEKRGMGVLALLVSPEQYSIETGRNYHIVIVPTAPVPVGGGLLFVPVEMVEPTDLSVRGADEHLCLDGRQRHTYPVGKHGIGQHIFRLPHSRSWRRRLPGIASTSGTKLPSDISRSRLDWP